MSEIFRWGKAGSGDVISFRGVYNVSVFSSNRQLHLIIQRGFNDDQRRLVCSLRRQDGTARVSSQGVL